MCPANAMSSADLAANLLSPPVLFFLLGGLAALLRSDLELPAPLPKALALFLLMAIGYKGGLALAQEGLSPAVLGTLGAAVGAAVLVPLWTFLALKRRFGPINAAALAATYGSVSAVTFVAAAGLLTLREVPFSGHMVAALALMEAPAIVVGVFLARRFAARGGPAAPWSELGRDALLNGSVFLLAGSLLVGYYAGPVRGATLQPFIETLFPGLLALFLLDLGLVAARHWRDLPAAGGWAVGFALMAPLVNGALGLALAGWLGLGHGDALLLVVLCASASYIAAPAALRLALPEANPALYVNLALGLTFPFNLVVGLPLYDFAVTRMLAA